VAAGEPAPNVFLVQVSASESDLPGSEPGSPDSYLPDLGVINLPEPMEIASDMPHSSSCQTKVLIDKASSPIKEDFFTGMNMKQDIRRLDTHVTQLTTIVERISTQMSSVSDIISDMNKRSYSFDLGEISSLDTQLQLNKSSTCFTTATLNMPSQVTKPIYATPAPTSFPTAPLSQPSTAQASIPYPAASQQMCSTAQPCIDIDIDTDIYRYAPFRHWFIHINILSINRYTTEHGL
jgi:hypothetical protein